MKKAGTCPAFAIFLHRVQSLVPLVITYSPGAFWRAASGKKLILQLSGCSFGIYLVHILILEQIQRVTPEWFYDLSPWIFMPLQAVGVFAVSFAVIYPLKKIKYLRAIVG